MISTMVTIVKCIYGIVRTVQQKLIESLICSFSIASDSQTIASKLKGVSLLLF